MITFNLIPIALTLIGLLVIAVILRIAYKKYREWRHFKYCVSSDERVRYEGITVIGKECRCGHRWYEAREHR